MTDPASLIVPWHGRTVRVRHDDPRLTPHSPRAAVIISAAQLVATAEGLARVLQATVGEWYLVQIRDEPLTVGLRRLPAMPARSRAPPRDVSHRARVRAGRATRPG